MEIKSKTIIDVRTREEFEEGNVAGSINIPLQEIPNRLDEVRLLSGPVVLVCASGNRSGRAVIFLKNFGVECENGGSWMNMNRNFQTV